MKQHILNYFNVGKLKQTISLTVCLCFIMTSVFPPAAYGALKKQEYLSAEFYIPSSLGKVISAKYYGGDEIIINIQDLHCHAETQKNIAGILKHIDGNYNLEQTYLEGGFGKIDTQWLAELNGSEIGKSIINNLLNLGYLNGVEYYSAVSGKNDFIYGAEHEDLYKENIKLLNEIVALQGRVSDICARLSREMGDVKREYSNKKIMKFDNFIKNYEKNRVSQKKYYSTLIKTARKNGISAERFHNIAAFEKFAGISDNFKDEKISKQFSLFINELKNELQYKEFLYLSEKSGSFANAENIVSELAELDKKYSFTEKLNLNSLKDFFDYMEYTAKFNPVELAKEEKELKREIFLSLGRNKYEQDIVELAEFIPAIEGYFTASITSDELAVFNEEFKKFKSAWRSFSSDNTAGELDKYADLLARYHNNNLLRDEIFASGVISAAAGKKAEKEFKTGKEALSEIDKNKKIKVIVTGGFHSRGLEDIFEQKKISYAVIMPKVTQDVSEAYKIHLDTVKGYGEIQSSTINIEPLSQEPLLISFPKVLAGGLYALETLPAIKGYSRPEKEALLQDVIKDILRKHSKGDIYVDGWRVIKYGRKSISEVAVKYKDSARAGYEETREYVLSQGRLKYKGDNEDDGISGPRNEVYKKPLSIINNFLKGINGSFYKIYTVVIAPVWEEFVFKALPFGLTILFASNPAFALPAAVTTVFGLLLFPLSHAFADKKADNPKAKVRTFHDVLYPSMVLTAVFNLAAFVSVIVVPWYAAVGLAYALTSVLHGTYNYMSLRKFVKGTVLSVFGKDRQTHEEAVSENIGKVINSLEAISNKSYERDRTVWSLSSRYNYHSSGYFSILKKLKESAGMDKTRKYEQVNSQLSALYEYITSSDFIRQNHVYKKFFLDIRKALAPVSGYVFYGETNTTLEDMLQSKLLDIIIKDTSRYSKESYSAKSADWESSVAALSDIPENIPLEKKLGIISSQMGRLFSIASENERLIDIIMPLSILANNEDRGESFFYEFMRYFENRKNEKSSKDGKLKNLMFSYFVSAFTLNFDNAFLIIKLMSRLGLLKDSRIPYELAETIKSYEEIKEYYLALSEPGADAEYSALIKRFSDEMGKIKIGDESADNKKNDAVREINRLSDIINASTSPLLEYQAEKLLSLGENLLKEKDGSGALILEALIPVFEKIIEKTKYIEHLPLQRFHFSVAYLYDHPAVFKKLISFFFYAVTALKDENSNISSTVYDYLYETVKKYYAHNEEKTDRNSPEYANNRDLILSVLRGLAAIDAENDKIRNSMFDDFGFSVETLSIITENTAMYSPSARTKMYADSKIEVSDALADKLAENSLSLNLSSVLPILYASGANGKKLTLAAIEKLFIASKDVSLQKERRTAAVSALSKTLSLLYADVKSLISADIETINETAKELNIPLLLLDDSVYIKTYDDGFSEKDGFSKEIKLLPIVKTLPDNILQQSLVGAHSPVYFYADGQTNTNNSVVKEMRNNFLTLKRILVYNDTALRMLINLDGEQSGKRIGELLDIVMKMAEGLREINDEHGQKSVNDVEKMINAARVSSEAQNSETAAANLQKQEINSLINEIHQTSIRDFMEKIARTKDMLENDIRVLNSMQYGNEISAYDLSDSVFINKDVQELLVKLASGKIPVDNLVFMDDILVWSTKLFAHSVDVFFNFGETDRGININYTESNFNRFGNFERLRYFAGVLSELGFSVELDMNEDLEVDIDEPLRESDMKAASLKAVLNKDSGLNEDTDLPYMAFKTIMLFRYSIHVNHMFNEMVSRRYVKREDFAEEITSKLAEKFLAGEIWYQYDYEDENAFLSNTGMTERVPLPSAGSVIDVLNEVLKYLKLDTIPESFKNERITSAFIDLYFNEPIERAFAEGKILLNGNGVLEADEGYDAVKSFMSSVNLRALEKLISRQEYKDEDEDNIGLNEMFSKSRTLNLAGKRIFSYRTTAFAGEYMFVSGYLKMPEGYLSVKGLMNPLTGRMKYTVAEFVGRGGRRTLSDNELKALLFEKGYLLSGYKSELRDKETAGREEHFKNRYIWEQTGERERGEIAKGLYKEIKNIDSYELIGAGTSEGNGTYVAGNVTFDKSAVTAKDILVAAYTTPNDIDVIEKAAAILTTGGGVLSHAAITTRELGKTSAVLSSASTDGKTKADTYYYEQSGKIDDIGGIKIKRVARKPISLKAGDRILVNGDTGSVLLFNDIDLKVLDRLQVYIDGNDADNIKRFFMNNKNRKDIRRLIEYAFFQTVGSSELKESMFALFDGDLPENVRKNVSELSDLYVRQRVGVVRDALVSLDETAKNNPYTAYNMAENLIKKLDNTAAGERQDIDYLKNTVLAAQEKIKDKLQADLEKLVSDGERIVSDFDKLQSGASRTREKKQLPKNDLRKIININRLSAVYNNFISNDEARESLKELKNRIVKINSRFEDIITDFRNNFEETLDSGILGFGEIFEEDIFRFGSKTTELAKVRRLLNGKGARVPDGVGVSTGVMEMYLSLMMREHMKSVKPAAAMLTENYLETFRDAVINKDFAAAVAAASKISDMIDNMGKKSAIVKDFERELNEKIQSRLGSGKRFSVRSSAEGEDKENRAYAGIGETQLDVGYNEILDNLKKTLKGFYSDRSILYMIESGNVVKPAVLIQEMVNAERSAVVFSRNKYGRMLIEALYGLGEAIVGGMHTPDSIAVDAESGEVIEYSVADKKIKITATGKGTIQEIVTEGAQERVFNNDEVREIADIIKLLDEDAGYSVDVELAVDPAGIVYILQRRPVTTNTSASMTGWGSAKSGHGVAVVCGDVSEMGDKIVDMRHPGNNEDTVTFYRVKKEKKGSKTLTVLMIDEKYKDLMNDRSFVYELMKRLNEDSVVKKRLNPSIFAGSGTISFVPAYYDTTPLESILNNRGSIPGISGLLSAA